MDDNDKRACRKCGGPTRKLRVDWIEAILRAALALPAGEPAPDDELPSPDAEPLPTVVRIDASGWLAWALGGLRVFSLPGEPDGSEGFDTREGTEGTHAGEETEGVTAHLAPALLSLAALAGASAGHDEPGEPERSGRGKPGGRPWVPSIRLAVAEARRAVMQLAMARHGGNLTHIAASFETSRRALREHLKRAGLYSPPRRKAKATDHHDDPGTMPPDAAEGGASP